MTYIKRCNPAGQQRLGITVWFIVCHFLHIVATVTVIVMTWHAVFLEVLFDRDIDGTTKVIGSWLTYDSLLDILLFVALGALPISLVIGHFINIASKNRLELQTIRVIREMTISNTRKEKAFNVFSSTKGTAFIRIKKGEEKEFKVVKGEQKFWVSEYIRRSNSLYIDVCDSIVVLEVGCDEDGKLWIREKENL